jgi:hypothetical protein
MSDRLTGYLHPDYAVSFSDWGSPLSLPQSGAWLLARDVPGTSDRDAVGCYPMFTCQNWSGLEGDIAALDENFLAVSLVTDPFGDFDPATLRRAFPDRCAPFKDHFVADLRASRHTAVDSHHQRNARRALRHFRVEVCLHPQDFLDDWVRLYQILIMRHGISGPQRFSRSIFARQLNVPGCTLFRAEVDGVIVGMAIWYEQNDVAYFHLSAFDDAGYKWGGTSYALLWTAWEWFAPRLRWLALGASAGDRAHEDGLSSFKRGWATGTKTTYFCGRVLNRKRYQALAARSIDTSYFPAYRAGEFAPAPSDS